ncbi:hypothetical protein QVD17_03011 [Tagetes erecta]|uniref:Uncharacterized protein n=1 Tax=Tagetes erecta TaxID=13708 RepID=A0AAD8P899_TARER|nr:hypothetical protein QVD17_03011 [Tagetes erecta]
MKRTKSKNHDSSLKPSKKSKAGIAYDDPSLSNGGQSDEVSNLTVGQTFDTAENLISEKKKLGKREKGVELKRPMITSARKKDSVPKTSPKAAGDSATTPNVVKEKHVTQSTPIPVIMGLQCNAVTVSQSKNSKQLTSKSPQNVVKPGSLQIGVPSAPKGTGIQEGKEADSDTITNGKRGRPFKTRSKNDKSSLPVNNQNGDASVTRMPNKSGIDLTLQQEKYKQTVTGKRGKRRMISLNVVTPPQDVQDSSNQTENGNSENNVEKSVDTVSDDQPLYKWFLGKQSLATPESTGKKPPEVSKSLLALTNGDGQTLTFDKRSPLWETFESMEAFRLIPQKPHFHPLDNIKESARERHAINKMVDFSGVFEETRRLQINHPRTEIDDQLDTLSELETHGFDIYFLRNRLMELLSLKDKLEGLGSRSKEVKDNVQTHRVEVQKYDNEIESIDKKMSDLLQKRDRVLKEKEKKDSEIVDLENEIDEIEEGMRECRCQFDELAATSFQR